MQKTNSERAFGLAALALAAVALCGCPTTQQARSVETNGFLSNYSRLEQGESGQALLRWVKPGADFARFEKVQVLPVRIWALPGSGLSEVGKKDRQALVDYFNAALVREIGAEFELVASAGPDTLRFSAALTDAETSSVALDTVSSVLPVGLALAQLKNVATGTPAFVGAVTVEVELSDAGTGEVLAQAVDRRVGGKSLSGATSSWSDAQAAFDYWAARLRAFLVEQRGGERR